MEFLSSFVADLRLILYGIRAVSFSRRVVRLRILSGTAGFHTFGMGIVPHEKPKKIEAMHIASELQDICKTWDPLLSYFKEFLSDAVQC